MSPAGPVSTKPPRPGYRWVIFAILALQYLLVYFHRVSPALMSRDLVLAFSISGTSLGILSSGYFYPYALMQLPVGVLADAWGARKTITLFSAIGAVGAILFGMAPNFAVATAARVLVGFGLSAVFVPAMRVCAGWFDAREYAGVSGILLAMGGVGWFVASTPLAWMTAGFGWRVTFAGIGTLTLFLSLLTWLLVVDHPPGKATVVMAKDRPGIWDGLGRVITSPRFWPLAGWFFFFGGILFGFFGLWAGPYLMDVYGLSKTEVGNTLAMVALGTMVGGPALGVVSDRVFNGRKTVIFGASLFAVVLWLVLFAFQGRLSRELFFLIFFCFGVFGNGIAVVGFAAAKELFPTEIAGTAVGAANFFAFLSAALYQPLTGFLMDRTGASGGRYPPEAYAHVLLLYLITSLFMLLCIGLFREKAPER
ncbi:MAG: MFS transporter [Desulfobacterales bacterium]|nr:MFS transporter [Desulfobacterales bacterium]